jgi:hypothetical protein
MDFRTNIPLSKQSNTIDYKSNLFLIGSCFTEHISDKLNYYKFKNTSNPVGILFQPKAIEKWLINSINETIYTEKDLINHNDLWQCFDAHSDLSHSDKKVVLTNLNQAIKQTKNDLEKASHIFITLGTAWVYKHLDTDKLVSNCHKIPQTSFEKKCLSIAEITESLNTIIAEISAINPKIIVIFTVSPVRHLKDGFMENQLSKSHLIAAIHQVIHSNTQSFYFPAYEIMMDDLRDYRFYKSDMVHPNETAINYIWQKFNEVWINNLILKTMQKVDEIQKGLKHKAFHPNSEKHQAFLLKLNQKIERLAIDKNIQF